MAATRLGEREVRSVTLDAGNKLVVTCDSLAGAHVGRYRGQTFLGADRVAISSSATFGPYTRTIQVNVSALGRGVDIEILDEVLELGAGGGAGTAAGTSFNPAGTGLSATTVQAAIAELKAILS